MTIIQLASVLQTSMVVMTLSIVVFWLLPRYRVDLFRQKLFAVRDEMFDYASAGNISFSDPAYILLRQQMNSLIRYGHQITFYQGLMSTLVRRLSNRTPDLQWNEAWDASVSVIKNPEVRTSMLQYHDRAMTITVKRLIYGSPILIGVLAVVALFMLINEGYSGVRHLLHTASRKILFGPFDPKHIEEEAVCATP